jgi:hypothetical protein
MAGAGRSPGFRPEVPPFDPGAGHIDLRASSWVEAGEFWIHDGEAWARWLDTIDSLIREHDAWALLVRRPDTDVVIVDVLEGWRARVRRWNGRAVRLLWRDG